MIKTLADALAERGYDSLTDVQQAVSEPGLSDKDLLVSAQTGSGKTVGFGLAIAPTLLGDTEQFERAAAPLALVIAPTRELAMQVKQELGWLYRNAGVRMASCVGGMDARDERRTLERGAHIVVGTPGRLRDHITKGNLILDDLRAVVLDEADEMLDMGFREDLEFMLDEAPEDRRTLMFSATVPPMIDKIAKRFQRDAVRISTITKGDQHADITYQAMTVNHNEIENAIINVLRFHEAQTSIVFANTRAAVARLMSRFSNRGFRVVSLSGELTQSERTHALQALRDGRANVCVATDVAARGIDLPNLDLVIHAELPTGSEPLLHRSGRTGRAGRKGVSVMIVTPKTEKKARRLLQWAKVRAEWVGAPTADEIREKDRQRLLDDPIWQEELTDEQTEFAASLLEKFDATQIAAAYLRLFQSQHSAPEDLSPPHEKPARKSHADFGPSTWFSVSVGRKNRAEPRWLLPMLLRGTNMDRTHIGAIRVKQNETFVEVSDAAMDNLVAFLDAGGEFEDGIRMTQLPEAPDLSEPRDARPPRRDRPQGDRPRGEKPKWDKPKKKADGVAHREAKPRREKEERGDKPAPKKRDWDDKPRKPREADRSRSEKTFKKKRVWDDKPPRKEPRKDRGDFDRKPRSEDGDTPRKPRHKKGGDKPFGKKDGKPLRKSDDKPFKGGDRKGGKPKGRGFTGANDAPRRKKNPPRT